MGAAEVSAFLTHFAVKRQVAASTQNQALAALLFLYKNVLKEELPWLKYIERAKRPARIPLVLRAVTYLTHPVQQSRLSNPKAS
jgi:hypothetical protein